MQEDMMMQELSDDQLDMVAGGGNKKKGGSHSSSNCQPVPTYNVVSTYYFVDSCGNSVVTATAIASPTITALVIPGATTSGS